MNHPAKITIVQSAFLVLGLLLGTFHVSAQDSVAPDAAVMDEFELNGTDIKEAVQLIAQKTGKELTVEENVTGKATVHLKHIHVLDALRIILEPNGLAYAEEDGTIRVMTAADFEQKYGHPFNENVQTRVVSLSFAQAPDVMENLDQKKSPSGKIFSDTKSHAVILMDNPVKVAEMAKLIKEFDAQRFTMVFELGVAKAPDVSKKVEAILTKNVGRVKFDERSNKLIVTDTSAKIEEVRKIVNEIDRRDRQVFIEAKVAQITLNDEHRMGVDWEAIVSDYRILNLAKRAGKKSDDTRYSRLSVGTIANEDYSILVEALDTVGTVDVLSNPSITATNNKEARILVGSTQPYGTNTSAAPAAEASVPPNAGFIDMGIKLFVTPTVHADGYMTLRVRPEISSLPTDTDSAKAPVVETSEAEATVHIRNGVTIVIGGLIKEEKSKSTKKVPILGDIPVLGMAFRSYTHNVTKTEVVIFLTPKMIFGDNASAKK